MDYSLFVEFLDLESSWFAMVSLHPPWLWGGESKHHVHVTGLSSIHLQQYKIHRTCILVAETSNSWVDLINLFRGFLPYFTCDQILNFQIIPPSGSYVADKASNSLLPEWQVCLQMMLFWDNWKEALWVKAQGHSSDLPSAPDSPCVDLELH